MANGKWEMVNRKWENSCGPNALRISNCGSANKCDSLECDGKGVLVAVVSRKRGPRHRFGLSCAVANRESRIWEIGKLNGGSWDYAVGKGGKRESFRSLAFNLIPRRPRSSFNKLTCKETQPCSVSLALKLCKA
jgi:hypothetical protein